jgi:glycosyltransferase involved in cell wall biosynthesis
VEQAFLFAKLNSNWLIGFSNIDLQSINLSFKSFNLNNIAIRCLLPNLFIYDLYLFHTILFKLLRNKTIKFSIYLYYAKKIFNAFINNHGIPDLIHAHVSYPAGLAATIISKKYQIPVAITEHMGPFPWPIYRTKSGHPILAIKTAYNNSTSFSAVGTILAKKIKLYGLTDNIDIIPNFVDENKFIPTNNYNNKYIYTFISVGGPSFDKGTDSLLRAFAKLPSNLNLTLAIAGSTTFINFYKKLSISLGIYRRIFWLGLLSRADIIKLYQSGMIFILPSRSETFGISYVEAIMTGIPVIATKCGGPEDIINNINGIMVPIDDVDSLADAMYNIYNNYHLFSNFLIRNDAINRFSSTIITKKINEFYIKTINK